MEKIVLSIFVPCFNEEKYILKALNNIKESVKNINYEILVVDDASTDRSVDIVEKFQSYNPNINLKIIRNKENRNLGYNFINTAQKALGKYYMIIFGNGGLPVNDINKLVSYLGQKDIILAYGLDKRIGIRKFISKFFVLIINMITFNNINYYNSDNIYLLEDIKSCSKIGTGFAYQAEIITELLRKKKKYIEVKIDGFTDAKRDNLQKTNAFTLSNIVNVSMSIFRIFVKQIIYLLSKINFFK